MMALIDFLNMHAISLITSAWWLLLHRDRPFYQNAGASPNMQFIWSHTQKASGRMRRGRYYSPGIMRVRQAVFSNGINAIIIISMRLADSRVSLVSGYWNGISLFWDWRWCKWRILTGTVVHQAINALCRKKCHWHWINHDALFMSMSREIIWNSRHWPRH